MPKREYLMDVKQASELSGIPLRTLRHRIQSGKIQAEVVPSRGGSHGQKYLIHLSSLPPTTQAEFFKQMGLNAQDLITRKTTSIKAGPTFQVSLPTWAEKKALAKADLIRSWRKEKERAATSGRVGDALERFLASYNTSHLLPDIFKTLGTISRGTIYRWDKVYSDSNGDYRALVPEWGNQNGRTKMTEAEKDLLLSILLHQNRVKVGTAINITKHILARHGIPSPSSVNTLRNFAESFMKAHYDLWVMLREGEKALNDKVLPFIRRNASLLEVGDVLVADGHRMNFQVINPYTGRPCRPVLLGFFDWASRSLLGYEIMVEENVQAVAAALRNAIIELGTIPKIVLLDNGKAFKAKVFTSELNLEECGLYGMFARLGIVTHFAMPYNAQSKPIERFFKTFSDTCERLVPSFTGASIEDKPARMRRNEKFLQALHSSEIPTIAQATELIASWCTYYHSQPHRGLKGRTPCEILVAGRGSGVKARELDYLMLSVETASIGRNGIRFLGQEYFSEELYGLREKVVIRYSFFDLTQIMVYTMRGEYLGAARLVEPVHPMASLTGKRQDMDAVKRGMSLKRNLKRQTLKVVKLASETNGAAELPWSVIVKTTPRIVEAIEADEAKAFAESAILPLSPAPPPLVGGGNKGEGLLDEARPRLYMNEYEKYVGLKRKETLTDEEIQWIRDYEATDTYRY